MSYDLDPWNSLFPSVSWYQVSYVGYAIWILTMIRRIFNERKRIVLVRNNQNLEKKKRNLTIYPTILNKANAPPNKPPSLKPIKAAKPQEPIGQGKAQGSQGHHRQEAEEWKEPSLGKEPTAWESLGAECLREEQTAEMGNRWKSPA